MKRKIKQVYIPYWEWEDFINGMWRKVDREQEEKLLPIAISFTGDFVKYGQAMKEVSTAWPRTMINSLTNIHINRRAFLGQCACQYAINCPEYIVRQAWKELTNQQRYDADSIAEKTIRTWEIEHERKNRKVHKGMGEQLLFHWPTG